MRIKTIVITLGTMIIALNAVAQGVVNFNNNGLSQPPDRLVYNLDGTFLVGTNYFAQLWYGASADSLTPHTGIARFRAITTGAPGTWSGGNRTLTGAGGVGTTIFLQVRVWDSNDGLTFDQAQAVGRFWGYTPVFTYSQVLSSPPAVTDTQMLNFQSFTPIPEPSVAVLLLPILGLAFLLRCRDGETSYGSRAEG